MGLRKQHAISAAVARHQYAHTYASAHSRTLDCIQTDSRKLHGRSDTADRRHRSARATALWPIHRWPLLPRFRQCSTVGAIQGQRHRTRRTGVVEKRSKRLSDQLVAPFCSRWIPDRGLHRDRSVVGPKPSPTLCNTGGLQTALRVDSRQHKTGRGGELARASARTRSIRRCVPVSFSSQRLRNALFFPARCFAMVSSALRASLRSCTDCAALRRNARNALDSIDRRTARDCARRAANTRYQATATIRSSRRVAEPAGGTSCRRPLRSLVGSFHRQTMGIVELARSNSQRLVGRKIQPHFS